jgi:hypothetical protein
MNYSQFALACQGTKCQEFILPPQLFAEVQSPICLRTDDLLNVRSFPSHIDIIVANSQYGKLAPSSAPSNRPSRHEPAFTKLRESEQAAQR